MSGRNRPRTVVLRRASQVRALSSPVRLEIFEVLRSSGAGSVAELADRVGRSPETLHYHVRQMTRAGILRVAARRRKGKRYEAVYDLAAPRVGIAPDVQMKGFEEAAIRGVLSLLRLSEREFAERVRTASRAARRDPTYRSRIQDACWLTEKVPAEVYRHVPTGRRVVGRLELSSLRKVLKLLDTIEGLLAQGNRKGRGQRFAFTMTLVPKEGLLSE